MRFTEKEIINIKNESLRCLYCYDAPCIKGCPTNINIPEFIKAIREDDLKRAARIIYEDNPLGAICAEICPGDELCMGSCTMLKMRKPINIPLLQHYATQYDYQFEKTPYKGKKVAVIGAGPGGLAATEFLVRKGIRVTIFEKNKVPGGVLNSTLPAERLSEAAKEKDFNRILNHEYVEIKYKSGVENSETWNKILKEFDAVIVATGLHSRFIKIVGIGHKNVYLADEFLKLMEKKNPPKIGKHVVIVSGGDVAMDCAVQAFKGSRRVSVYYRRSRKEMPASKEELERAEEAGVSFNYLASPVKITRNNDGDLFIEFIETKLEKVENGRAKPVPIKNSNFKVKCDGIVFAIGQEADVKLLKKLGLEVNNKLPEIGEDYQSSIDKVYIVGDLVNGGGTVVEAVNIAKQVVELLMEEI